MRVNAIYFLFFKILFSLCVCIICVWICMPQDVGEPINLDYDRLHAHGLFHWLEGSDISGSLALKSSTDPHLS